MHPQIDLDHDGCEQYNRNFQGYTRNQRGHHYYTAHYKNFTRTVTIIQRLLLHVTH